MFSLRHLPWALCLGSCSVYDASLLDDAPASLGSGAKASGGDRPAPGTAGRSALGGGGALEPDETSGGDDSEPAPSGGTSVGGESGGGSPSVAGAAGTPNAGATTGGAQNPPTGVELLDDMEDGNFYLSPSPPRFGYWYVAGDKTTGGKLPKIEELVAPLLPTREASTEAVHFVASGFTDWGSSLGLSFANSSNKRTPYDAGNAVAISFWVRGSVAKNAKLRVLFPLTGTDPSGALCGGTDQGDCLDHFATQISVTPDWQLITLPFKSLYQAGWGVPLEAGFDAEQMLGIEWTAGVADVDIWLDDLALVRPE